MAIPPYDLAARRLDNGPRRSHFCGMGWRRQDREVVTVGEAWLAFTFVAVLVGVPAYLLMSAVAAPGIAIAVTAPAAFGIGLLGARMRLLRKAVAAVVLGL